MLIDTLSIYEKLKESMDPAAAEKVAGVLGEALSEVERSMREASEQRLSRIEQTLETLVEVARQHSQEIAELREATQRNTEAIAELREATQRNTEAIAEL
ncbi:MAG: hypothetical protein RMM08_09590, partial [Armatimonadota bacterium]|nr:hypothetical protein [Armatimonadota bacterium]